MVLVVVDAQTDFITGVLGSDVAEVVKEDIQKVIHKAISNGEGVLFTMDVHDEEKYEGSGVEGTRIPFHCPIGKAGSFVDPDLTYMTARANVKFLEKSTFMPIKGLKAAIDKLSAIKGENIRICGYVTDICVVSTALYLRSLYPKRLIGVYSKACAGTSIDNHMAALKVMKSCLIEVIE